MFSRGQPKDTRGDVQGHGTIDGDTPPRARQSVSSWFDCFFDLNDRQEVAAGFAVEGGGLVDRGEPTTG